MDPNLGFDVIRIQLNIVGLFDFFIFHASKDTNGSDDGGKYDAVSLDC